ncbi:hypothetical protein TNCV_5116241 [Trichonephila clavipes]|nr:hypothetical protein TNCV_5116241 [Trichonephila clavipes]
MILSRMENTTFAMPSIIDSHDMGLRTVLLSRCPKRNAYSTPIDDERRTHTRKGLAGDSSLKCCLLGCAPKDRHVGFYVVEAN